MTKKVFVCFKGGADWEGQWQEALCAFTDEVKAKEWSNTRNAAKELASEMWQAWHKENDTPRRDNFSSYEEFVEAETAYNIAHKFFTLETGFTFQEASDSDSFWYEEVDLFE